MSEYQYYEFAAIDGPISDEGLRYARGCSSRANVSRVRWQNTYTFGDFHGSVDTLHMVGARPSHGIRRSLWPTTRRPLNCRNCATPMHRPVPSAASSRSSENSEFATQITRPCC